ncbi:NtaA/DmoA family FMN-dependent monooxygenase [Mycolicibacterium komossense]|uniref:NtaA/DmoA family FMN-dependent monooxygenase n=1 Tax=Mycolicibacterium komossense TaxID=1779 RepID=A0ABT3CIT0_9MYCO|nr:NtaA/DmoA family FMN-dependent monooxygenase [Mycolicibacterium komossense]MCV7229360.1 NtaA/DmoA family FMN-dependent monooxygenase [Mycolicibacterium komossense]
MKSIILSAFEINGVNLTSQGLWAHPENQTYRYKDLNYWVSLAQLLDRGGFDLLFLADSYGYPRLNGATPDVAFEQAVEIPKNDPMLLVPAMASHTSNLSFAITTSTTFEHPYANARRLATLDHLTGGRLAWNVVTTSSAVVCELFGRAPVPHDERYAMAQDFLDVTYQLLESSWEDGAVVADKASRLYADASRVHPIQHDGPYFSVSGYFNCEPSPQRTPVILQAGASSAGRTFAAANAEMSFLQGKDAAMLRTQVQGLRDAAVAAGRKSNAVKGISGLSVVTGSSRAHAQERLEEYLSWVDADAARTYYASMTGIDLASLDPNASFATVQTEGGRTQVDRYRENTVREATADFLRRGMRELIVVGTPDEVADEIVELVDYTGLDGFNFTPFVSPGSYVDFIDHVVPQLRRRGLLPAEPRRGTLRERIFGDGPHLGNDHQAARVRHAVTSR